MLHCAIVCPNDWVQWHGSCYQVSKSRKSSNTADRYCQKFNATLVNIISKAENTFVRNTFVKDMKNPFGAYIGLFQKPGSPKEFVSFEFHLQKYFNWETGEPNIAMYGKSGCAAMRQSGLWHLVDCEASLPFICEIPGK